MVHADSSQADCRMATDIFMKEIYCVKCGNMFDPKTNRAFIFPKLPPEEQIWPLPALENMHKELKNFNIVKCPKCGSEFKSNKSRILFVFSPMGYLIFSIAFIMLFVLYVILFVVKK